MIAFSCQAEQVGQVEPGTVIIAIPHDDRADPLGPFRAIMARDEVYAFRGMSPLSMLYRQLPQHARWIFDNEADNRDPSGLFRLDPGQWVGYLQQVKAERPDILLIGPAMNTARWPTDADIDAGRAADPDNLGDWPLDPTVKSMCYFRSIHIPTFATVKQIRYAWGGWTNPKCVTEIEQDPQDPAIAALDPADPQRQAIILANLLAGARAAIDAGAECAALWGANMQVADALDIPGAQEAVRQINATYTGGSAMAVDANDPVIVGLKKQIADFTEGMRRIVEGKYGGADGAAAIVVALEGGADATLVPQPDYSPKA